MSGPSKRTLIAAAIGIASLGVALGAVIGWRALAGPRNAPVATTPETNVGLVERPTLIPHADGGGGTDAALSSVSAPPSRAARTASARGRPGGPTPLVAAGALPAAGAPRVAANSEAPGGTQPGELAAPTPPAATEPETRTAHSSSSAAHAGHATAAPPGAPDPVPTVPAVAAVDPPAPDLAGPQGPSVGGYRPGDATDATGTIDPNAFQFVYRHYRPQISACHSDATRGGQDVVGTMRVRVRLGTNGHVVRTRVISNTTNSEALATCVTNTVQTWHYPSPEGGEVEFDYNFGFGS